MTIASWKKKNRFYQLEAQTELDIRNIVHIPKSSTLEHTYVPIPWKMEAERDTRYDREHTEWVLDRAMSACLTKRERFVLQYYYGLGDTDKMTLEVIGDRFELTREAIRQIKLGALKKLKAYMI